jgi:hypothetical protein
VFFPLIVASNLLKEDLSILKNFKITPYKIRSLTLLYRLMGILFKMGLKKQTADGDI